MAIKRISGVAGPSGSIPTSKGWVHPLTGELLKSQLNTQEQLDEWNGVQILAEPFIPEIEPVYEEEEIEVVEEIKPKKKKSKKYSLFG